MHVNARPDFNAITISVHRKCDVATASELIGIDCGIRSGYVKYSWKFDFVRERKFHWYANNDSKSNCTHNAASIG